MAGLLVERCRYATPWCDFGVTFDRGPARLFSTAIFETYFSYQKALWIAATDSFMHFHNI